jgi:predicted RNase H-like HicB family nuclease
MLKKIIYLTHIVYKDDDMYTSTCPELDISSCGDTIQEAADSLVEAISLYFNSCEELGILDRIFKERHIKIYYKEIQPKSVWESKCKKLGDWLDLNKEPFIRSVMLDLEKINQSDPQAILH